MQNMRFIWRWGFFILLSFLSATLRYLLILNILLARSRPQVDLFCEISARAFCALFQTHQKSSVLTPFYLDVWREELEMWKLSAARCLHVVSGGTTFFLVGPSLQVPGEGGPQPFNFFSSIALMASSEKDDNDKYEFCKFAE